jgi:hypothetical protein
MQNEKANAVKTKKTKDQALDLEPDRKKRIQRIIEDVKQTRAENSQVAEPGKRQKE